MENKKNIAVVCNYKLNADRIGGMDRFFKAYNDEVLQQGHQIMWFFCGEEIPEFYEGLNIALAKDCLVEDEVLDFLKSGKPFDIIVTHFTALCTSFYRDLKRSGVGRIIAVDHNPRPLKGFPMKKRLKNKAKGMLYGKYINAFIGVSQYTKDHILKDYGKHLESKTSVVHNGIDYKKYIQKDAATRGKNKLVVVSHLRPSKGIQDLIESLAIIPDQHLKQINVDIYGEGFYEERLKELAKEKGVESNFRFLGSSSDLPSKLYQYDYLLQPTHMECFSLSLLESIAANVPVITTTIGGNLELIQDGVNGFIHKPTDVPALANILQEITSGERAIEGDVHPIIAKEFALEKMLQEHVKLTLCT